MNLASKILLLFSVFVIPAFRCTAQNPTGKEAELHISHIEDFEVTGEGNAKAWSRTEWIKLARIKGTSPYETKVKLLYSDKGIYALYHCEDKKINATLHEDFTSLWKEDVIEIFFWPDETYPIYLEYELSPLNHELVILVPNFDGQSAGWTPWNYRGQKKTRKATSIVKSGGDTTAWLGEIFIPYALMRPLKNVPPQKGTKWRANIYRIDYDDVEPAYWSWQPVDDNFHEFGRYGTFVFD